MKQSLQTTEIGLLPKDWEVLSLGECAEKPEYGYTDSATAEEVGPKFLRITDIQDGRVSWDSVPYCTCDPATEAEKQLQKGDIVVARIGATTGKAYYISNPPRAVFASYLIRIRAKNSKLSPKFLSHIMQTPLYWSHIDKNKGGRLKGGVNIPILQAFKLPVPKLEEQNAITQALDAVHRAKEAREVELALEQERKAALMAHLFKHGARGEPRKQTDIGEIPKSWEIATVADLITLQRGKDLPVQDRKPGEIPVVGSNGRVGSHNEYPDVAPVPGVTVGRSGSVGLLTYQSGLYWPLNTVLYGKDFHGNNSRFVYYWLHQIDFKKYAAGVSVPTLNRNLVHPVAISKPPYDEQLEIVKILEAQDRAIAALENEITLFAETFYALLDQLMAGKLSVQPLLEKPASKQSEAA